MNTMRFQLVGIVLFSALLYAGCSSENGGGTAGGRGASSVTYDSPQAVFDAAKAAVDKDDWAGFCACLEPASRDKLAAIFGFMSAMEVAMAEMQGDDAKKKAEQIKEVFTKHGITEEMLKDESEQTGSMEDAMMEFIKPIKDRQAFIADMGKVTGSKFKESIPIKGATTLNDVTEDGDTAKGTMKFEMMDQEQTDQIDFKKVDGSWGIELKDGP